MSPPSALPAFALGAAALSYVLALVAWRRGRPGLAAGLVVAGGLGLRLYASCDDYLHAWDERFHALVAKVDGKPGFWLITSRGGQFLRGEIAIPERVKTFRNKVLEHSTELIHINELKGKIPVFQREFAYEYQRPAIAGKVEQAPLFVSHVYQTTEVQPPIS